MDSTIFCSSTVGGSPNCHVQAIRPSTSIHAGSNFTYLGLPYQFSLTAQLLPLATGESTYAGFLSESTATELYIGKSSTLFSHRDRVSLYRISKPDIEIRLGQVLNTYYLSTLDPQGMTGSLESGIAETVAVPGLVTEFQDIYVVNWTYLAIYLVTWILFFAAGVVGVVLKLLVVIPDVLGYVSSFTRDNRYVRVPRGGSYLDGIERARVLGDLRLRMGDVGEGDGVGYLAVESVGYGSSKTVRKRGLYA